MASDLMLHFNGANGSTVFIDSGANAFTAGVNGTVAISTSVKRFGTGSGRFEGGANRLTFPANAAFNLGAGDFTVNASIYPVSLGGDDNAVFLQANNIGDNANRSFGILVTSTAIKLYYTTNGSADNSKIFSYSLPLNAWSDIEFNREAGVLYLMVNGALIGSTAFTESIFSSTADMCIGTFGKYAEQGYGFLSFNGYIDELRIIKGTAKHTASFTQISGELDQALLFTGEVSTSQAQSSAAIAAQRFLAAITTSQGQSSYANAEERFLASIQTSQAQSSSAVGLLVEFAGFVTTSQAQSSQSTATLSFLASVGTSQGQQSGAYGEVRYFAATATSQAQSSMSRGSGVTLGSVSTGQAQSAHAEGSMYLQDPSKAVGPGGKKSTHTEQRLPTVWIVPKFRNSSSEKQ